MKEAASLKKYNLFTDSRDLLSQSSRSSLSSPPVSTPSSPAMALASPTKTPLEQQPPSPLAVNGQSCTPQKNENGVLQSEGVTVVETPLGKVEQKEAAQSVAVSQEAEAGPPAAPQTAASESTDQSETQEVHTEAAPETVVQREVISVKAEKVEVSSEPRMQNTGTPEEESIKTDVEAAAAQIEAAVPSPDSTNEPTNTSAEDTESQTVTSSEKKTHCESSEIKLEAPSSGQTLVLTPSDISLDLKQEEAEPVSGSDQNSLGVSVGSESAPSDVESMEEVKAAQSSEGEASAPSDVLEDEATLSEPPVSSDDPAEDETTSGEPAPRAQTEAVSEDVAVGEGIEAGASVEPSVEATEATTSQSSKETPSSPEAQPLDSIKEIRDLVVEVIEVEELV